MTKKGRNLLIWNCYETITKKVAYIGDEKQLQNHSFILELLSATSILSRSPMAYNTTETLDKLTCTNYVEFGKCQDRFRQFSWSKNDSNYLDIKLKERRQKYRCSTETKPFNGKSCFQPVYSTKKSVYAVEESAGQCSRKFC